MSAHRITDLPHSPARDILEEAEERGLKALNQVPMNPEAVLLFGLADMIAEMRRMNRIDQTKP